MRQPFNGDNVAISGAVVGLLSSALGWLTLKPNRLAAGTGLSLWDGAGWDGAAVIIGLWLGCLVISLTGRSNRRARLLGAAANLIIILTLFMAGTAASRLLQESAPFARISIGAGIWASLAAAYVLIFAARQGLGASRLWRIMISWSGLAVFAILLVSGWLNDLSVMQEFLGRSARFRQELLQHILLFGGSVAVATLLGIPLGIWAARSRRSEKPIFFIANITQTVPSLALFGLLIAPLSALSFAFPVLRELGIRGVGPAPAIIALIIYSLLPIVRNTFVSLRQIDPAVIDAGRGMGMSRRRIFRRVEVPLAAPLVLEGVRTASVQAVGNTAVAALIGAGGLGWFIFQGLGQAAADLIILGAIPIIILALVVDTVMRIAVRAATPKGVRTGQ